MRSTPLWLDSQCHQRLCSFEVLLLDVRSSLFRFSFDTILWNYQAHRVLHQLNENCPFRGNHFVDSQQLIRFLDQISISRLVTTLRRNNYDQRVTVSGRTTKYFLLTINRSLQFLYPALNILLLLSFVRLQKLGQARPENSKTLVIFRWQHFIRL